MTLDFTLDKYKELCSALLVNHYVPLTFSEYLENGNKISNNFVIIRHDIDRKPLNALKMAELENEIGVRSTYYFRYPYTFKVEIIKRIIDMGHEIGYHYEVLSKANGDHEKAKELFEKELGKFREIYDVKTICMHGSPLSKFDNRDLWKAYNFTSFGIIGESYLSLGKDVDYFSDTGRNWNSKNKKRDFIPGKVERFSVDATADLIDLIEASEPNRICVVAHPERWASAQSEWLLAYVKDSVFNIGKTVLSGTAK
jgi:hypothetical protein